MPNTHINAQELLEQLLSSGRDLAKDVRVKAGPRAQELTKKGKDVAAKGEDYLMDKLDIEDTEAARVTLRKGVGAGAAAGALALLLSSRSGRKMATIGGLAGLGALAWKSYQKNGGTMPKSAQDIIGLLQGPKAEARSEILIRAMIAAARSDGNIDGTEIEIINAHDDQSIDVLKLALANPESPQTIAALADSEQAAREIYAVSCRIADGLNPKERDYLDELAMAMRLDPELAARIETDARTG